MEYRFVYAEDGPPADLKIIGYGETLWGAIEQVGHGLMNSVVPLERMLTGRSTIIKDIVAIGYDDGSLMFDYYDKLISLIEDDGLIGLTKIHNYIATDEGEIRMYATFLGKKLDIRVHKPELNIKAVTFHQMALEDISDPEHGDCWRATVVFDL